MKIPNIDDLDNANLAPMETVVDDDQVSLLEETIKPRKNLPPLLLKLSERKPEKLDYLGVSYGLTQPLLKFWTRAGFTPVYISQVANNLTGEHTSIMIKPLKHDDLEHEEATWLKAFYSDFRRRLVNLLGFEFRAFSASK
jgi:N-acetyltransferase 10